MVAEQADISRLRTSPLNFSLGRPHLHCFPMVSMSYHAVPRFWSPALALFLAACGNEPSAPPSLEGSYALQASASGNFAPVPSLSVRCSAEGSLAVTGTEGDYSVQGPVRIVRQAVERTDTLAVNLSFNVQGGQVASTSPAAYEFRPTATSAERLSGSWTCGMFRLRRSNGSEDTLVVRGGWNADRVR
jgi:hypothetical protein